MSRLSQSQVHLVTQAQKPRSEDIGYRERRYLLMMAVRVVCFLVAIVMFTQGAGWLAAFPAVAAVVIPYFAVVFANGGREPNDTRGFQEYQPSLPQPHAAAGRAHLRQAVIGAEDGAPARAAGQPEADDRGEPIQPPASGDSHIHTV